MSDQEVKYQTKRTSILVQVAIFFAIGMAASGIIAYFAQMTLADSSIRSSTESRAAEVSAETMAAIRQYPAYPWLMAYWYEHAGEMDIEYDAPMEADTKTAAKARKFQKKHPELQLEYATTDQIEALSAGDQKRYAEIIYSWVITRIDQIKQANHVDYLYCCLTDDSYSRQFFLLSGADAEAVRGTDYGEVYTIGVVTELEEDSDLREGMRQAREESSHLSYAGDYMDYYAYMDNFGNQIALIGSTYSVSDMIAAADKETKRRTINVILLQLLLAVICLALIYVFLLQPMRKVQKNIRRYKETKDSSLVLGSLADIHTRNEIMELSQDISELAVEIDEYLHRLEEVTKERERISAELNVATQIQTGMLPRDFPAYPDHKEFDIYATMDPAKEVGGDFYDFFLIDEKHLCMVMADVSGKGIPAALFMAIAKALIKNMAQTGAGPAEILYNANNQVCEENAAEMFVTVWIGILDLTTGQGIAANAGHEHPALCHRDGQFVLVKYRHSPAVGTLEGIPFKEHDFQLQPGDTLFVYTDGVPEATNGEKVMFGTDQMLQALNEAPDQPLEDLLQLVKRRAFDFTGDAEQFDDLTMLAMRWYGK